MGKRRRGREGLTGTRRGAEGEGEEGRRMVVRGKQDGAGTGGSRWVWSKTDQCRGARQVRSKKEAGSKTVRVDDPLVFSATGRGQGGPRHGHDQASKRFISEPRRDSLPALSPFRASHKLHGRLPVTWGRKTLRSSASRPWHFGSLRSSSSMTAKSVKESRCDIARQSGLSPFISARPSAVRPGPALRNSLRTRPLSRQVWCDLEEAG